MLLEGLFKKKLTEYAEAYGFEAGFDLLVMEIEAELSELYIENVNKLIIKKKLNY